MASRVEKYYEEVSTSKKRVVKNKELYKAIYAEDETYSNIEGVLETPVTKEIDIVKKARNQRSHKHPKNTDVITYKYSTGFEALIGYLYLSKQDER